eukprot:gene1097-7013_t
MPLTPNSPPAGAAPHSLLLDVVLDAARAKGTVDAVLGDRARCAFNAAR